MQIFGQGMIGSAVNYVHYDYTSAVYPLDIGPTWGPIIVIGLSILMFAGAVIIFHRLNKRRNLEKELDAINARNTQPG